MDFALTAEQLELKRQARAWLSERHPLDRDWDGPPDDRWGELGKLGVKQLHLRTLPFKTAIWPRGPES